MVTEARQLIEKGEYSSDEIGVKTRKIYDAILQESEYLDAANFTKIHLDDIARLFDLYDEQFFEESCRKLLGDTPMFFRLSKRMTKSGGMATRRECRDRNGKMLSTKYELAVATTLLFQTFQEDHRPVVMSGIECRDRLQALQRIIEHEMIHLIEMLIWVESKCSAQRYQSIAKRFFGHTDYRHQLITPREVAFTKFGIKAGDQVSFEMDGQQYVGVVNQITKRATVLVENSAGQRYSDGKQYVKFYVPVPMLRLCRREEP